MVPRPERHARVEMHDYLVRPGFVLAPGGTHHDSLTDAKDVEELLPAILPLALADPALAELRQRREVRDQPNANVYLGAPVVGSGIVGEIRLDHDSLRSGCALALVRVESPRLLDGNAALSVPVEYLGQRLHVLGRSLDAQLQPLVGHQFRSPLP